MAAKELLFSEDARARVFRGVNTLANAVKATFKNGILTVTVPKNARAIERTKRIPINSERERAH